MALYNDPVFNNTGYSTSFPGFSPTRPPERERGTAAPSWSESLGDDITFDYHPTSFPGYKFLPKKEERTLGTTLDIADFDKQWRLYAKMADILIFFCLHSNQPNLPRSWVQKSKEYFTWTRQVKLIWMQTMATKSVQRVVPCNQTFHERDAWRVGWVAGLQLHLDGW